MDKTERLIEQALSAEDRELLARHGEPGYFSQAFGLFRGTLGWVVWWPRGDAWRPCAGRRDRR